MEKKNYIDEKGNYHNIENLTLAQIYASGVQEGYRKARQGNDRLDCEGCRYDNKASTESPCNICKNNHPNMFEWKGGKE